MLGLALGQFVDVLTRLESRAIRVYPWQCARLRHRRSTCTLCADYCPVQAITWGESLQVDPDTCTGCGICAAVCPTGALEAQNPTNVELLTRIQGLAKEGASIAFACPRYLEARGKDADRFLQVNCLGRLDESILVGAVSLGAQTIWLLDSACQECPYAAGRAVAEQAVQRANALLQACGVPQRIFVGSQLPSEIGMATRPPAVVEGLSRRDFFSLLARQAAKTTVVAVDSVLGSQGAQAKEDQPPKKGELPVRLPVKRQLFLAALRRIGKPVVASFEANGGPWAQFGFQETCTGCQMCAFFCPTGALSKVEEGGKAGVAFKISQCTNCRLCQDICYKEAVVLSSAVDLSKVFDDAVAVLLMRDVEATPWLASPEEKIKRLLEATYPKTE
ncbi:MAG: 4Fe-4S dicluster domain-containing protein [Chloroflexi bacterium]|nr:4Fe-4S dicluster domain-containing protein [Chloroflexota bacterium]